MNESIRLTVDLSALAENWRLLSDKVFPAECAAVVKADAYSLGASRIAPVLFEAGCRSFFVTHVEEALDLRDLLPKPDIYVLNGIPPGEERAASSARLTPVVNGLAELARLKSAGRADPAPIALHVDTGIHRLGLDQSELTILRERQELLAGTRVQLVMTHLVTPETRAHPLNQRQRRRFEDALRILPSARASIASSAGIFLGSTFHFDMVRPGAALYGINPVPGQPNPMRTVFTLEARILQIHDVPAGETVGYGADHLVEAPSRVATLSIGYADGFPRALGSRGAVFAAGRRLPAIGRISMDLMTVDLTATEPGRLKPGDWVEMIGPNRPLDEVAGEAETISYEILTRLNGRSPRKYLTSPPN